MSMAEIERLIAKGRREPIGGLFAQFEYSLSLFSENKPDLLTYGATEEDFAALATAGETFRGFMSKRQLAETDSEAATRREQSAIAAAKDHVHRLYLTVPMAIRKNNLTDISADDFTPSSKLRRSTDRILKHLVKTRDLVATLDAPLKPYFAGVSPVQTHDDLIKSLRDAEGAQSNKRAALPLETREVHEAKGRLLEMIDDLNRIGRLANLGNAKKAGLFNKDILLKARRGASKTTEASAGEAKVAGEEGEAK